MTDTLCRFGGDEFLYLAEGIAGTDEARLHRRTIPALARRTVRDRRSEFRTARESRASSCGTRRRRGVTDVVRDADVALYEAKRLGKGRHFLYVPGMHHNVVNRFSLVQQLRQAVSSRELAMHYQPIVRSRDATRSLDSRP